MMRAHTAIYTLLLALLPSMGNAQEIPPLPKPKEFRIIGDSLPDAHYYFVGEAHGIYEGRIFEFELIRKLHRQFGITNVVMEYSKAQAYLFNLYFEKGDTAILEDYPGDQEARAILAQWKSLYDDTHIRIQGIDFERLEFVTAALSVLKTSEQARNTELYRYLQGIRSKTARISGDKRGKKARISILDKATALFRKDRELLKTALGNDHYAVLENIFENPAQEKHFNGRDAAMALNLGMLGNRDKFICIMGLGHSTLHTKGTLANRFVSNDELARHTAIVDMVCKNCYLSSYMGVHLNEMVADYEEKNKDVLSALCDQYCDRQHYTLVDQKEAKALPSGYSRVKTYYALFKDQPKQ